ncbi:MAG: hypothetical protein E7346_01365 [Clostridiales bacterium]|nr:hypothetical protein [Clostridiales bacterium]
MLGKKKKDNKKVEVLEKKELITTEPLGEELVQAPSENLPAVQEKKAVKKKETSAVDKVKDAERSCVEKDVYEKFPDLARLMNTTVENLRDEFFLFQIRKLMSKIGKVVVRHSVTENELEKIFLNANALTINQVLVSPVYLPTCERIVKKHKLHNVCVGSIIDFPFGESSFKSKINNVKDSVKIGVDEVSVMIPSLLTTPDHIKTFRKQVKKIAKSYKGSSGVVLNATDIQEEQVKRAMKIVGKSKLSFVVFAFGEATVSDLKEKMQIINKYKGNKKVSVIANVDRADSIQELFKQGVDRILSPFADAIGQELVERFEIKSVKLH